MDGKPFLILGIGNLLLGDEGVGVHAAWRLERESLPEGVSVVDGGTGGFHLLSLLRDFDPVLFLDATMDGAPTGTVTLRTPRFASDFPRVLSAHDIGLRDLLESATLIGELPSMHLITVSIGTDQPMSTGLSPPVLAAVDRVVEKACSLALSERGAPAPQSDPVGMARA